MPKRVKVLLTVLIVIIGVPILASLLTQGVQRTPPQKAPMSFQQRLQQEIDKVVSDPVAVKVDTGVVKVAYSKKSIWDTRHLVWDLARTTCKVCKILFRHPEVQTVVTVVSTEFSDERGEKRNEVAAMIMFKRETASKISWEKLEIETVPMSAYRLVFDAADNYHMHPAVIRGLETER